MKSHFKSKIRKSESGSVPEVREVSPVNDGDLPRQYNNQKISLSFLDKYLARREASTELRAKLSEITATALEAQRAAIQHQLMLNLDIHKKRLFQYYMDAVGNLNKDLIEKSNAMERDLRDMLFEEIESLYKEKRAREEMIECLPLTNEERQEEIESLKRWMTFAREQVEGKLSTLLETHSESLKVTLELLKDTAIRT